MASTSTKGLLTSMMRTIASTDTSQSLLSTKYLMTSLSSSSEECSRVLCNIWIEIRSEHITVSSGSLKMAALAVKENADRVIARSSFFIGSPFGVL